MKVIFSSSDKISITILKSLLERDGIKFFCFDENIGSVHGGINAFPVRIAVLDSEVDMALINVKYLFSKHENSKNDAQT